MSMRTEATQAKYDQDKQQGNLTGLLEEPAINEWDFWRLIDNAYPHDRHHTRHHLLVLKEGDGEVWGITDDEWHELQGILTNLNNQYDVIKINFTGMQSVKGTPHIHLLNLKDEYK